MKALSSGHRGRGERQKKVSMGMVRARDKMAEMMPVVRMVGRGSPMWGWRFK